VVVEIAEGVENGTDAEEGEINTFVFVTLTVAKI
jgi:hypothetical protein